MRARAVAALVLTAKRSDPLDRTLVDATVKQARDARPRHKRKGIVRPVALQRRRSAQCALIEG